MENDIINLLNIPDEGIEIIKVEIIDKREQVETEEEE
mgnify:CR=1 FL=1